MRGLTVQQPWAWAILHGGKTIENRSWRAVYTGPVALHASRTIRSDGLDAVAELTGVPQWEIRVACPLGAVIAVCRITATHPAGADPHGCCAPWGQPGLWHWVLGDVQPLRTPVLVQGTLGLWPVSDETAAAIQREAGR